jgi:hypothetical protein
MKITHCTHHDKWGISHKFASKRDNPFQSTKGLAYDIYSHAQFD